MKNIMVFAHHDEALASRMQAAIAICRALHGHLTCLDIFVPPTEYDFGTGSTTLLVRDAADQEAANRKAIEAQLAGEEVSWHWLGLAGELTSTLAQTAQLADLIVLSGGKASQPGRERARIASDVAMRSRRPLLIVPPGLRRFDPSGRAMIGWDGSASAAAAMRAAVPLLKLAQAVEIFAVGASDHETPPEEAALFLSRYGIAASVVHRDAVEDTAVMLLRQAYATHVAYLVMGAYGHSRIAETLFGGTTRFLLSQSKVPLLIAH